MAVCGRDRVQQIWAEQIQIHMEDMGLRTSFNLEEKEFELDIHNSNCEVVGDFLYIGNRAHRLN